MIRLHPDFRKTPLAHRGLHDVTRGRPENSRAAFQAAMDAGYGIELDLQLSKDGVPMVFHDYALQRLTPELGPVAQRTADELGQFRLTFGNEGIPTLAQALDLIRGQVPLLIEIKDQDGNMGPDTGRMEQAVCHLLSRYCGPVGVMSFNPYSVAACMEHGPAIPRGLSTCHFPKDHWPTLSQNRRRELVPIPDYDRVKASFISHQWKDLNSPHVARVKEKGADVLCWTVRSPDEETAARKIADNITFEQFHPRLP